MSEKSLKRRTRVRTKLRRKSIGRPRLSVFRSHQNIYAQVIDDAKGATLAAASTLEKDIAGGKGATRMPRPRSAKQLPSGQRPLASSRSCSTEAITCFMAA